MQQSSSKLPDCAQESPITEADFGTFLLLAKEEDLEGVLRRYTMIRQSSIGVFFSTNLSTTLTLSSSKEKSSIGRSGSSDTESVESVSDKSSDTGRGTASLEPRTTLATTVSTKKTPHQRLTSQSATPLAPGNAHGRPSFTRPHSAQRASASVEEVKAALKRLEREHARQRYNGRNSQWKDLARSLLVDHNLLTSHPSTEDTRPKHSVAECWMSSDGKNSTETALLRDQSFNEDVRREREKAAAKSFVSSELASRSLSSFVPHPPAESRQRPSSSPLRRRHIVSASSKDRLYVTARGSVGAEQPSGTDFP